MGYYSSQNNRKSFRTFLIGKFKCEMSRNFPLKTLSDSAPIKTHQIACLNKFYFKFTSTTFCTKKVVAI